MSTIANLLTVARSNADPDIRAKAHQELLKFQNLPAVAEYLAEVALAEHRAHMDRDQARYERKS